MKAADDPQGMSDTELQAALRHHTQMAESYQRIATTHQRAANAAREELQKRQGKTA